MHVYLVLYKVGLKKVPKQARINTEIFKIHSARSASSSKASMGGAILVEILKRDVDLINLPGKGLIIKDIIQKDPVFR